MLIMTVVIWMLGSNSGGMRWSTGEKNNYWYKQLLLKQKIICKKVHGLLVNFFSCSVVLNWTQLLHWVISYDQGSERSGFNTWGYVGHCKHLPCSHNVQFTQTTITTPNYFVNFPLVINQTKKSLTHLTLPDTPCCPIPILPHPSCYPTPMLPTTCHTAPLPMLSHSQC